jgi:nucleotide-binding universal stress UspA family protein
MYKKIMVPVDLAHADRLDKALTTAADLAKHYGAALHYVGVTSPQPGPVAHNPTEYAEKLDAFAQSEAKKRGLEASCQAYTSHDPAVDLDDTLMKAVEESGSDLVVMASHLPGLSEHIFASNAGYLASHAGISVFVIR